ncbi:MAG: PadR family transcriptional regulator, regulatory protein PadR [Acidimicrobiaceae bacterium]|nr:PadR family transcriptional regulator, regulatory protein PadR [Acidimicrobiaceae bacterium]MDQ1420550.1 PadR family transcriptional regulator, regulatory protein PadR [Acidimicrobiaceae bacterium]MDQ1441287.1 PadR family transcriptional regulator, regulatory protein PadR [Acidimicrobiaceae bacterium]
MPRKRLPSPQTTKVLVTMAAQPDTWRYGYDLAAEIGLKTGSLYPILMRLADRGLLGAAWEENPPMGRPARHLYRLTPEGLSVAAATQTQAMRSAGSTHRPRLQTGTAT